MARKIENWRRRKEKTPKAGLSKGEVQRLVERTIQQIPSSLPKSLTVKQLRVEDELSMGTFDDLEPDQVWVISPSEPEDGQVLVWTDDVDGPDPNGATFPGNWQAADAVLPDGTLPGAVDNLVVTGGPRWLAINWDGIENHNFVTYNVHVSETQFFTADASNKVGSTSATLFYAYALQDGTILEYWDDPPANTVQKTYYIQVIPEDADGVSVATPEEDAEVLDPNGPDDIAAGAITAAKLEAILVLATQLIAGSESGARVELGVDVEDGFLGIRAYAGDGTLTFSLDGTSGDVFVRGDVQFGDSFLLSDNSGYVEFDERASSGFQTPAIRQTKVGTTSASGSTTVTATFDTPSIANNQVVAILQVNDQDGTYTNPSISGWTLIEGDQDDFGTYNAGTWAYYKTAVSSPTNSLTITLGDTVVAGLYLIELTGVVAGAPEDHSVDVAGVSGNGFVGVGSLGNTSQANMISIAGAVNSNRGLDNNDDNASYFDVPTGNFTNVVISNSHTYGLTNGSGLTVIRGLMTYYVTSSIYNPDFEIQTLDGVNSGSDNPTAAVLFTYAAKAATATAPASPADKVDVFAMPVGSDPPRVYAVDETGNMHDLQTPAGVVEMTAAAAAPIGYLLCDGTSYLRTDYPALFTAIGTTYGAVDGTHFTVPNFQGRFPAGFNSGDTNHDALGETGGSAASNMPAHTHGAGTYEQHFTTQTNTATGGGSTRVTGSGSDINAGINGSSGSAGSGSATSGNLPPYLTLNFIIKF